MTYCLQIIAVRNLTFEKIPLKNTNMVFEVAHLKLSSKVCRGKEGQGTNDELCVSQGNSSNVPEDYLNLPI